MIILSDGSPARGRRQVYAIGGTWSGRRERQVPVVIVEMWPGRGDDAKRRIASGITEVFEREGVPREAVTVIMHEPPKNNWARAGKLHSDQDPH